MAVVTGDPVRLSAQTPEQRYGDWARPGFRPQEYEFRRNRIIDGLRATGGGLLLVPSSDGLTHGETFRQLEDFWYLTGLEVVQSMLVLDAERGLSTLFMPPRDPRFENPGRRNDFPGRPLLDDYQLRGIGGADDYRDIAELDGFLRERLGSGALLRVNAGSSGPVPNPVVPLIGSLDPPASLIRRLRDDYPEVEIVNAFDIIARLRMVKTPAEIMRMRRAAAATMAGIRAAAALVRQGVDERTLQGEFERACREAGSQSIPFTPIIKSGPNSLWPWRVLAAHYDRRNRALQDGDLVILDVGCEVNGYVSDVGRTFPANGTFTEIQREKLLVSTRAAEAIIAAVRPGVTLRELTEVAYDAIPDEEEPYMQTPLLLRSPYRAFFGRSRASRRTARARDGVHGRAVVLQPRPRGLGVRGRGRPRHRGRRRGPDRRAPPATRTPWRRSSPRANRRQQAIAYPIPEVPPSPLSARRDRCRRRRSCPAVAP